MKMERPMRKLLLGSRVIGVFGEPDSGKTHLMMSFAWWMTRFGGTVLSNVPLVRWTGTREVEADYPGYIVLSSFSALFAKIAELLHEDRDARFLVLLDEAGAKFGKASWSATLSIVLRSALTLVRKFNVSLVFTAVSEDILLKDLREDKALVQVKFFKSGYMLRKHSPEILSVVDSPKQAVLIHWPLKGVLYDPNLVGVKDALAIPVKSARESGSVYFDTKGISSWDLGAHPATGKPFNFDEMLRAVAGIGWDVPEKLYNYMRTGVVAGVAPPVDVSAVVEGKAGHGASTQRGIRPRVVELILAGMKAKEVMAETDCSERFFYTTKRELRAEGKVA